ncbi:MAG: N-acetyl-alpha-D-glucosaminyl L-malate synthase BshA [Gemmatimonadota bacterium]|nr:N-acetyl-alpha-D-glucosaminyl L-malate synthase BshA [Gemmatimonadota bacterium]MDQ8169431.1 N-acetyl-alpha-D-glucosaminyl L-malate synthase BshA [Gemmatimonadota bacterium]MDQ8177912.1 N-acetyl-alpha-D-glucosaminyl L-malate synthase BshA [Gemmatimonadota bacterium]
MKIGITCYPTYGGSGAVATELGIALAARGHEVHFISYEHPFRLPHFLPRVYFHEVSIGNYPLFEYPPYDLALAVRMHDVALAHELDLLHVHYAIPHATSAWIAKEMLREQGRALPVVTTLHGTDITIVGQDHSYQAITKFSIERSDRITAVSQWLKDETTRAFGCSDCPIEVIPNFVDPTVFDRARYGDALRQELGGGRPVLMHISNFRPVKRVVDVIRVFARVRAQQPCVLVMVGDGPDRHAAEEEARRLGVAAEVRFLGKIDTVAPLFAAADVYVFPSESESFGLSALEALASGVPVVAARVGGVPEVVRDGVTGALLPLGDVEGMAEAVRGFLDPSRWREASAAAAADARARFATGDVVAQYERLYADAMDGR